MKETRRSSRAISRRKVATVGASETALWERLLEPSGQRLSPELARYIFALRFPQLDVDRMNELAKKAGLGELTLEEHFELENYERTGHVLSLMKSKARSALRKIRSS